MPIASPDSAPLPAIGQPAPVPPSGKLPSHGNILPGKSVACWRASAQATGQAGSDARALDKSTSPDTAVPPAPVLAAAALPLALPAPAPPNPAPASALSATAPARVTVTPVASPGPAVQPGAAAAVQAALAQPATAPLAPAGAAALPPPLGRAQAALFLPSHVVGPVQSFPPAPPQAAIGANPAAPSAGGNAIAEAVAVIASGQTIANALPGLAAASLIPPPALPQTAPGASTTGPAIAPRPAIIAPAAPALTAPALADMSSARVSRQSAAPRAANTGATTPTGNDGSALSPAPSALPVAAAGPTVSATAPATTPPQDFAALVDRLIEARAAAQGATPPRQVSTEVNHADFGKVSLTFQQGTTGLSVSMTSPDPGFARAAQSAIAAGPTLATAGQSGTVASQLVSPTGSLPHPDAAPPAVPAGPSHSAGFAPTGGGSAQSQAHSQSQPQPQPRPGAIAANRPASGSTDTTAAADSQGIFA